VGDEHVDSVIGEPERLEPGARLLPRHTS
jgi:hypothetical protein